MDDMFLPSTRQLSKMTLPKSDVHYLCIYIHLVQINDPPTSLFMNSSLCHPQQCLGPDILLVECNPPYFSVRRRLDDDPDWYDGGALPISLFFDQRNLLLISSSWTSSPWLLVGLGDPWSHKRTACASAFIRQPWGSMLS